jgi:cyclase
MEHAHETDVSVTAGRLHEVAQGVFAWMQPDGSWWINNAGAVAGPDGTFIVDTCATEARTRRFLDAVTAATHLAPVRLAVNTHEHGDHTYGNCLLPASATLIGHTNMRAGLLADPVIDRCPPLWEPVPDWGTVNRRVPDLAMGDRLDVHLGDRPVELHHPGFAAHTTGDVVAWLPDERILFAGDLIFHGLTPLVMAGSVEGALHALAWLADFAPEVLVPGHGPLVHSDDLAGVLADHERYYRFLLRTAEDGIAAGRSPLEAAQAADLGEFDGWADAERIVLNLHRAYADAGHGTFDVVAAFTDAMAWNGGPLTTHVCCAR